MSGEDLEQYESENELSLWREYRDVIKLFRFVVETDSRYYLANQVERVSNAKEKFLTYELKDAWVWDKYRPSRFLDKVTITSAKGITIEQLPEGQFESLE